MSETDRDRKTDRQTEKGGLGGRRQEERWKYHEN